MIKLTLFLILATMVLSMGKKPPINYKTHKWRVVVERAPPNIPTLQQCIDAEKYWSETKEFNPKDRLWKYINIKKLPKDVASILNGSNIISTPQKAS